MSMLYMCVILKLMIKVENNAFSWLFLRAKYQNFPCDVMKGKRKLNLCKLCFQQMLPILLLFHVDYQLYALPYQVRRK